MTESNTALKRSLGPWMLWGLGVGYVISGMYFGWNLGLPVGGVGGMAVATLLVTVMYLTFSLSYTELACAIPRAGGAFDYITEAMGARWGFIGGMAQNIEFLLAPPAIALSIGAYFHLLLPVVPVWAFSILAYFVFTTLNVLGVKAAARFELFVTVLAVGELLVFAGATLPHVSIENFTPVPFPNGAWGILAAIPFAIWFYLAIEGLANVSEETIHPQRNMVIGFGAAIFTLMLLCGLTFVSAVGVNGWQSVVYASEADQLAGIASDSPLPLALGHIYQPEHWLYRMLISIGIFGLVASFHGILLAAGRSTFEFGRVGFAPKWLGEIDAQKGTPAHALWTNMVIGLIAIATGKTGDIIILACFGAVSLYVLSMTSLLILRKTRPDLERPFLTPGYPATPWIALSLGVMALFALGIAYPALMLIFACIMASSYLAFHFLILKKK